MMNILHNIMMGMMTMMLIKIKPVQLHVQIFQPTLLLFLFLLKPSKLNINIFLAQDDDDYLNYAIKYGREVCFLGNIQNLIANIFT